MSIEKVRVLVRGLIEGCGLNVANSNPEPFLIALEDFPRADGGRALLEELSCEKFEERLIAARFYLHLFGASDESHRAISVLIEALNSDSDEWQSIAYGILQCIPELPTELSSIVERHLVENRVAIRHLVPSVAIRSTALAAKAVDVLRRRLVDQNEDGDDRFEAALALIREGIICEQAWQHILELSKATDKHSFFELLSARMIGIGKKSKVGMQLLLSAIRDPQLSKKVRGRLVRTLGMMVDHTPPAKRMMVSFLGSDTAAFVIGAADSLLRSKSGFPCDAIRVLVDRLDSPKLSIRNVAATAILRCCPPLTGVDASFVVKRIAIERDIVVLEKLASIAAIAGEPAIQPLLSLAESEGSFRNWIAMFALASAGERARGAMLKIIAENPSSQASRIFSAVLVNYRISNGLDVFKEVLLRGEQEEATNLLIALSRAGREAEFLTPELLEIAISNDDWRSDLSCTVIESIGPIALSHFPPFEEKYGDHRMLRFLRSRLESQGLVVNYVDDLKWIKQPNWIRVFVHLVDVYEEHGPLGKRRVAELLEEKQAVGILASDLSVSESNLRKTILSLEKALSERKRRAIKLFDSGNNKSGGLTPDGKAFAIIARSYVGSMKT